MLPALQPPARAILSIGTSSATEAMVTMSYFCASSALASAPSCISNAAASLRRRWRGDVQRGPRLWPSRPRLQRGRRRGGFDELFNLGGIAFGRVWRAGRDRRRSRTRQVGLGLAPAKGARQNAGKQKPPPDCHDVPRKKICPEGPTPDGPVHSIQAGRSLSQ